MKDSFRNVVLVGDKDTKLDFIYEFLNESSRNSLKEICQDTSSVDQVVEVTHSENFVDEITTYKDGRNISVSSAAFPSGIKFSADLSEMEWIYCENAKDADIILFIEAFPFTKKTLIARIELIEKFLMDGADDKTDVNFRQNIQFRGIFFKDKDQHFGDTDKDDIDERLKHAPGDMTSSLEKSMNCMLPISSLIDFKTYKDTTDLIDIVSCNMKTFETLLSVSMEKFRRWKDDLDCYCEDYESEYNYQFANSIRPQEIHETINKFEAVKGCNDIMGRYAENYRQKLFDKIKEIAVEQYKKSVEDICFWDIVKDTVTLSSELDRLCQNELTFKEQLSCPKLQAEYQKILTEKKIDTRFSEKINDLERDKIPGFVYQYLKKKEEILCGVFDK